MLNHSCISGTRGTPSPKRLSSRESECAKKNKFDNKLKCILFLVITAIILLKKSLKEQKIMSQCTSPQSVSDKETSNTVNSLRKQTSPFCNIPKGYQLHNKTGSAYITNAMDSI